MSDARCTTRVTGADHCALVDAACYQASQFFRVAPEQIGLEPFSAHPMVASADGTVALWEADIDAYVAGDS